MSLTASHSLRMEDNRGSLLAVLCLLWLCIWIHCRILGLRFYRYHRVCALRTPSPSWKGVVWPEVRSCFPLFFSCPGLIFFTLRHHEGQADRLGWMRQMVEGMRAGRIRNWWLNVQRTRHALWRGMGCSVIDVCGRVHKGGV